MNPILQNIYRIAQSLGVVMTLVAMLLVSSSQGAFEECPEESVSQEIELVLGRRDQRKSEDNDPAAELTHSVVPHISKSNPPQNRSCAASNERLKLNGFGSYLRI